MLLIILKEGGGSLLSPHIQRGEPVFSNTRVPVKNLFDYLNVADFARKFF